MREYEVNIQKENESIINTYTHREREMEMR